MGLTVDEYQLSWLRGRVGAELSPAAPSARLAWLARVAWMQDFSPVEREITARVNGAPSSSFQVHGTPAQSGGVELNLGLGGQMSETVLWGLEYTGEFRSETSGYLLQGRLSIAF